MEKNRLERFQNSFINIKNAKSKFEGMSGIDDFPCYTLPVIIQIEM